MAELPAGQLAPAPGPAREQQASASRMSLAYLIGHYPAVTLTFILREIALLREQGARIQTVSINPPEPSRDGFTEAEREEAKRTFYVKGRGLARIAMDHAASFLSTPLRYLKGLAFAARLGGLHPREFVYHLLYFAEAIVVGRWMLRQGVSHLHVHFANASSTVALLASKVFPVRFSITVHGPNEFYGVEFYRLREKIEGASFICCIGQFCRSQLMKLSSHDQWHKFRISPLGVDPDSFLPRPAPHGSTAGIVCVGRLVPEKGQAVLLAATAALLRRNRDVHVHFVGAGPDREALENEADRLGVAGAVSFHGSVNQRRLRSFLEAADVFVLPSFAEGIPVALMEAMAMEIPCVSTTIAGIPELIESGVDGILVPPSDPELLSEAIERLIADSGFRLRIAHAGRRKIIERYNLRPNVEKLAAIFAEQLESKR